MVELLPLVKEDDVTLVKDLLEQFIEATGSEVAKETLSNWESSAQMFVKVNYLIILKKYSRLF